MINDSFNTIIKFYLSFRYRRIAKFMQHPKSTQDKVHAVLLDRLAQTSYGKSFSKNIIKRKDYASALPIVEYDDIKNHIFEMMAGNSDILWPGKTSYFAKSSGTTGDTSKYIPVTPEKLKKNLAGSSWDAMALLYHLRKDANVFGAKNLVMGGSLQKLDDFPDAIVGDVSAIMIHTMPSIGRPFYTPDFETALMSDWEEKIERMADICSKENVVLFGGVPTWTILLFQRILEKTGKKNMLEVWPEVRTYVHGGVGFEPYKKQFKEFIPTEDFNYMEAYNASEGYFGVQDRNEEGMLLLLDNGIYYEFIPMEEMEKDEPQTISLEEVELGKNYALVISTFGGLWRYLPGDTVTFTSLHPYRIKVTGRTKHFINVFGEEVMIGNTDKALAMTTKIIPAKIRDYTVAPIFLSITSKGGHEWMIEFEEEPTNLDSFAQLLDDNLKSINSDYAAKRHRDLALDRLRIVKVPPGTFLNWMRARGKIGGQNKVPRLSNDRKYIEQLLDYL